MNATRSVHSAFNDPQSTRPRSRWSRWSRSPRWKGWAKYRICKSLRPFVQHLVRKLKADPAASWSRWSQANAEQSPAELDQLTDDGLLLREAIPVRSAEYWMELGYPELALEELATLSAQARLHPWPDRIRTQAKATLALET